MEYMNYKEDKYLLNEGKTKKGNPSYFFSKKTDGKILDKIPEGYEIYENPNGLVFLIKIQTQIIANNEIDMVKSSIPKGLYSKVDVKKNAITIYI